MTKELASKLTGEGVSQVNWVVADGPAVLFFCE